MLKPCLDCGRPTQGSRCTVHDVANWRRKRKVQSGWQWTKVRGNVYRSQQVCTRCDGTDDLQVHHKIPLSSGGSNNLDNLELLCAKCHRQQHT